MKLSTVLHRVVIPSTFAIATATSSAFTASPLQAQTLNGAGSTFAAPLYEFYASEIRRSNPKLTISYQGIGSGAGVRQFTAGTVDFAGSDTAMTDAEAAKVARGVIFVPTAGGAIAIVYNLPGVNSLKLSRTTLPAIFSGQITTWNDPKIKADNPGVNLPNVPIRTIVRADSSGTSFIFTNHLSSISPSFKSKIGASPAPKWTLSNVVRAKGNVGVAAGVRGGGLGSIGYVDYVQAVKNRLQIAQVQNKKGDFVSPSLQTANQALGSISFPSNFQAVTSDPAQGYPIVGLTWLLVNQTYSTPEKASAIKTFVKWVLTEGQSFNERLNYTRIPAPVTNQVIQSVNNTIK